MQTLKGELTSFETVHELKSMLSSAGPCISVYLPLSTNLKENELQWKDCLRMLEARIGQYGAEGRELLESLSSWEAVGHDQEPQGKSVAVFRSPDTFSFTWIQDAITAHAVLGPHFNIRPLLPELVKLKTFYLLALSRKDVRMLRCTSRTSEEVALGAASVVNYDAWMNSVQRDHNDRDRGSTGPSSGHNKAGIIAPMGGEEETKNDDLSHFFKQIDRGVNEALRGHTEPLVLAAVDYELPVYVAVNSYPHLAPEAVHGAPNSLKGGEMHARALDALTKWYDKKVDEAIGEWNHRVGSGASSRLKDVVTAAHDGRVLTLLVSDSLQSTGIFDEATNTVKARETGGPADEDLINDAAVQTILHAGKVLVTPNKKMPNGAPLAATFRF